MLLRLLVRRLNGVDNELGLPSPKLVEITDALETLQRPVPAIAFEPGVESTEPILRLLRLEPDEPYYGMRPGIGVGGDPARKKTITVRTGSLPRALMYLSQGVDVPGDHVEKGLTTPEWPPGSPGTAIDVLTLPVGGRWSGG